MASTNEEVEKIIGNHEVHEEWSEWLSFNTACVRGEYGEVLNYLGEDSEDSSLDHPAYVLDSLAHSFNRLGDGLLFEKVLERLVEIGVDIDTPDEFGATMLHMLLCNYHEDTVYSQPQLDDPTDLLRMMNILLKYVDINDADDSGNTPLHTAVDLRQKDVVKFLLEKGADISCKNNKGETPLEMVRRMKRTDPRLESDLSPIEEILEREVLWGIWFLESPEYASYFQWLPKEIVEDTFEVWKPKRLSFFPAGTVQDSNTTLKRERTEEEGKEEGNEPKRLKK